MRLFETLPDHVRADLVAASDIAFLTAIHSYPAIQKAGRDKATRRDVVAGLETAARLLNKPSLNAFARGFLAQAPGRRRAA